MDSEIPLHEKKEKLWRENENGIEKNVAVENQTHRSSETVSFKIDGKNVCNFIWEMKEGTSQNSMNTIKTTEGHFERDQSSFQMGLKWFNRIK